MLTYAASKRPLATVALLAVPWWNTDVNPGQIRDTPPQPDMQRLSPKVESLVLIWEKANRSNFVGRCLV
jgi:hypothetical protein